MKLAWVLAPFAMYLAVLQRLWFDAPILDDYYIALSNVAQLRDAHSLREWLGIVMAQHAEHRIAVVRLAAWGIAAVTGHMDFRLLTLLGNLTVLGLALLAWADFRHALAAAFLGAAAILLMQWSYYEASLMATAALPVIGALFFSSACLVFATRAGAVAATAALAFALLAAGSQANGLLALPLAAMAAVLMRRPRRAAIFGVAAVLLWAAYFLGYERPGSHPSPFLALSQPLTSTLYFLQLVGGIVPGRWASITIGVALISILSWLAWRGAHKRFPGAALCVIFVFLTAAAITAGRAPFGTPPSPRYAIYPTWLLVLAFLTISAELRLSGRKAQWLAIGSAVAVSFTVSWMTWRWVEDFSRAGHMLMKAIPADARITVPDPYPWTLHPGPQESRVILAAAEERGLYSAPRRPVYAPTLLPLESLPAEAQVEGVIDQVTLQGNRLHLNGWSPIAATIPDRTLAVYPAQPEPKLARYQLFGRPDVATLERDATLIVSGFRMDLEYATEEDARRAAGSLCIAAAAPGRPATLLRRADALCALQGKPGGS